MGSEKLSVSGSETNNRRQGKSYLMALKWSYLHANPFAFCLLLEGFFLGLLFDREHGGSTFFRNVGEFLPHFTAPRRKYSS
jgi:hypothetical protein